MPNRSAFVLASAMGHSMIVNRFDTSVGRELLDFGQHDVHTAVLGLRMAEMRRKSHGNGVVIIDGGANIGCFTVFWSRYMEGASEEAWGKVIAFEPQQWPFYALCGNLALNNCFNVEARNELLMDSTHDEMRSSLDASKPHDAGAWPAKAAGELRSLRATTIDDLRLPRLDILKLDLEGGEPAALRGAHTAITLFAPIIIAEHPICGHKAIEDLLPDYEFVALGIELLCVSKQELSSNPELSAAMREIVQQLSRQAA